MKARAVSVTLVLGLLLGVLVAPSASAFNYTWDVLYQDANTTATVNPASLVALTDTVTLSLVLGTDVLVQRCGNEAPASYCLLKTIYTTGAPSVGHLVRASATQAYGCATITNGGNVQEIFFGTENAGNTWTTTQLTTTGGGGCDVFALSGTVQYVTYMLTGTVRFVKFTNGIPAASVQVTSSAVSVRIMLANDQGTTIRVMGNSAGPTVTYYESTDSGATWGSGVAVGNLAGTELFLGGSHKTGNLSAIVCGQEGTDYFFADTSNLGTNWAKSTITGYVAGHACVPRLIESDGSEVGACIPTFGGNIPVRFAHSEDFGGTWTLDTVYDDGAAIASVAGCGLDISPGGVKFVAVHYDPNGAVPPEFLLASSGEAAGAAFVATATASVTNLVGFDVDPSGSGLIARTDIGANNDNVRAYLPEGDVTLTEVATSPQNTDCNRHDGVSISDKATVFIRCENVAGAPITIQIRSLALTEFTEFPDGMECEDGPADDDCDDIGLESGQECSAWAEDQTVKDFHDFKEVPLDYSYITGDPFLGDPTRAVAFAYSTTTGIVGFLQFSTLTVSTDCTAVNTVFSAAAPNQISVWSPAPDTVSGSGQDSDPATNDEVWLVAAGSGLETKLYRYNPESPEGGTAGNLEGTLSASRGLGVSSVAGVSCAKYLCLMVTNAATDNLHLVDISDGQAVEVTSAGFPRTVDAEAVRGVVLDETGEFFGYVDGASLIVGHVNDNGVEWDAGDEFGSVTLPGGTFKEVRFKVGMQSIWIATDTTIAYYAAATNFPDDVTVVCTVGCGDDVEPAITGGIFGPGVENLVSTGTFSAFGASLFMGVLMMAGMAVTLGSSPAILTKGQSGFSIVLALFGVILGFLLAWAFGLFSTTVVASVVILALIGIGIRVWISRNSGV